MVDCLNEHFYLKLKENYNVSKFFGFKTGGRARYYISVESLKELKEVVEFSNYIKIPYKIIGNGTNVLLSDFGYDGLLISLKKLSSISICEDNQVKAMAGATISNLISFATNNSLSGMEELVGIPATVGGAIFMNAGAFGNEISNYLDSVQLLKNGKLVDLHSSCCRFSYRKSGISKDEVIISAKFNFRRAEKDAILSKQIEIISKRNLSQPKGRTCGSVFRNKREIYAAKLIEGLGLKGHKIGGAEVSKIHANFIVANDGCTSTDIYNLIKYIKNKVYDFYKIRLLEEIEYLGEFK